MANAWPGSDTSGADGKLQQIVSTTDYFTGMGPVFGAQILDLPPVLGLTGGLQVYSNGSGLQVRVRTGAATVFGFQKVNPAEVTIPIPAATGGTRTDLIVLRLDALNESLTFERIPGTPAAPAPVRKTAPVVWDLPLARVTVPAGATSIPPGNVVNVAAPAPPLADRARGEVAYSEDTDSSHWSPPTTGNHVTARSLLGVALRCSWQAEPSRKYKVTFHAYRIDMLDLPASSLPQNPTATLRMIVKPGTAVTAADADSYQVNAVGVPAEYGCDFTSGTLTGLAGVQTAAMTIEANDSRMQVQVACGGSYPAYVRVEDIGAA